MTGSYPVQPLVLAALQARIYVSKKGLGQFSFLYRARDAAMAGDTIHVVDGTYEENDLLRDQIHWHFNSGATVQWTASGSGNIASNRGIFDDRGGAVSCKITGKGTFKYTASDTDGNSYGLLVIKQGATSKIFFQAARLEISLGFTPNQGAVYVENCDRLHLDVDEIVDLNFAGGTNQCSGIYWQKGYIQGRVGYMQVAGYCLYAHEPAGSPTASMFIRGDYWESNTIGIYTYPGTVGVLTPTYRTWIDVLEVRGVDGALNAYGGRTYGTFQKLSTSATSAICVNSDQAGELWLNVQKISHKFKGLGTSPTFTGKIFAQVMHFEDDGSASRHLYLAGTGELHISGLVMKQTAGNCVEIVGAGQWNISNYRMEVVNDAAGNDCILVANSGLVIRNLAMICGASAQCVDAAAPRTITNYGSVAKRAKGANVTVNVEPILVDANVT